MTSLLMLLLYFWSSCLFLNALSYSSLLLWNTLFFLSQSYEFHCVAVHETTQNSLSLHPLTSLLISLRVPDFITLPPVLTLLQNTFLIFYFLQKPYFTPFTKLIKFTHKIISIPINLAPLNLLDCTFDPIT